MQTKHDKMKCLGVFFVTICVLLAGCTAMQSGAEMGANAYASIRGELVRIYPRPYDKVLTAAKASLEQLKIKITSDVSDGINTTLKAAKADGTPVVIKIAMEAPKQTRVGVRTGVTGFWDRKVSQLIHDHIAKRI